MQYRDSHIAVPSRGQLSVLLQNSASYSDPKRSAQLPLPARSAVISTTSLPVPIRAFLFLDIESSIRFCSCQPTSLTAPHCAVSELQLVSHEAVGIGTDDTLEVVTFSSISILKPHCEEGDRTSGRHAESTRVWRDGLLISAANNI